MRTPTYSRKVRGGEGREHIYVEDPWCAVFSRETGKDFGPMSLGEKKYILKIIKREGIHIRGGVVSDGSDIRQRSGGGEKRGSRA